MADRGNNGIGHEAVGLNGQARTTGNVGVQSVILRPISVRSGGVLARCGA